MKRLWSGVKALLVVALIFGIDSSVSPVHSHPLTAISPIYQRFPQGSSVASDQTQVIEPKLNTHGNIQLALDEIESAVFTGQQAERKNHHLGDEIGKLGSSIEESKILQQLGLDFRSSTLLPPVISPSNCLLKALKLGTLGRLLHQQGQKEQAILAYTQAISILQGLCPDWTQISTQVQVSFRKDIEPIYREMIALLLEGHPSQIHLKKAKETIAAFQRAELQDFGPKGCWQKPSQSIEKIDDHAAIFYSIVLPRIDEERLVTIVSLPNFPLFYDETRHPSGEIAATIEQFKLYLNPVFFDEDRIRVSVQLYDWLIRPAEAYLQKQNIQTLVFSLDSVLQNVPMAALFDGNRYLIEQYSVAVAPGAQLFESVPWSQDDLKVLLGGLSTARQGFSALPAVLDEVHQIADILTSVSLLDRAFTFEGLQKAIARFPFPIVHLATHGQFSSHTDQTFLLTWNRRIQVRDFDQLLQQRDFDHPIELLVLSACQTATGDQRGALGLTGIALGSGVRSVLGTLWQVSDVSTAQLMVQFYQELVQSSGMNKALALRSAQRFLLQQPEFQHPFFWSPYILVGNWL